MHVICSIFSSTHPNQDTDVWGTPLRMGKVWTWEAVYTVCVCVGGGGGGGGGGMFMWLMRTHICIMTWVWHRYYKEKVIYEDIFSVPII